jgi:hypothetical protein
MAGQRTTAARTGAPPPAAPSGGATRRRVASALGSPTALVGLGGVVFAALAVTVVGLDREVRWDEVTYLAQVTPGQPDVWFGPQRARGMSVVLLPVALFGAPTGLLRGWLVLVHATALVLAYLPWTRVAGRAAGAAALVAAVGWVPLYFAVEGYPNLLAGFAAVAAAGTALRWVRDRADRDLVLTGLAIAVVAWLRPTESVWIAAALTPVVIVLARRDAWRPVAAFAAGGIVGWLPWLVEAVVRFSGPLERLAAARGTAASGADRNRLIQYLNLVEGPVRQVVEDPVLTVPALLLLLGLGGLALLGVVQRQDLDRRLAARVGGWCALVLLVPYLVLNAGINLRYLLPAMLLAAVPIGAGLVTVAAAIRRAGSVRIGVGLALVAALTVGWQANLAAANAAAIAPLQARPVPLGTALAAAADGAPCAFLSNVQWPEIQWHSGCLGEVLDPAAPTLQCHDARRDLAELADAGYRVFVLHRGDPPFAPTVAAWPVQQLAEPEGGVWRLYERPTELGPDAPPTIPPPQASTTPCPPSRAPDTADARLELRWRR